MPYIKPEHRELLDPHVQSLIEHISDTGDLNYVISTLAVKYLLSKGLSYDQINAVSGVLQKVAAEFDVRVTRPYEDLKIFQNGDIPEYGQVLKLIRKMQHTLPTTHVPDDEQVHG
jgi:hypothetical protein